MTRQGPDSMTSARATTERLRTRARLILPALLMTLLGGGCDRERSREIQSFVLADSAGVEIARNRPLEMAVPRVHLGDAPLFRLGSEDEDRPDFFGQINSVHLDAHGNLWVADIMTSELRVFSVPDGGHLFTVGRRGEGPGEFAMPVPIGFDQRRAWVWDQQLGRLTVLDTDGRLIELHNVVTDRGVTPRLIHRTARGSFVARLPESYSGPMSDGVILQDTVRVWELQGLDEAPRLLGEREGVAWIVAEGVQAPIPFTEDSHFGVRDDRVVFTDSSGAPVLDVVEGGRLTRRIRLERERPRATSGVIERELEGPTRTEAAATLIRQRMGEVPIPNLLPTWSWVRIAPSGHVFALQYGTLLSNEVWDVFDPAGRLVAMVTLEDEAHLMEVSDEVLVVMEMPRLRGPGIAVYRFKVPD